MKRNELILIVLAISIVLTIVVIMGCDPLPYEGPHKGLISPSIFWSDVQYNPENTSNPVLKWYSTDSDGLVLDYHFTVLLESTVDSLGGPAALAASMPSFVQWTIVHEDSSTIPLYADPDTGVFLDQYVFVRAMDDDSLFSSTIYVALSRKNHPPTCYLDLPIARTSETIWWPDPQWCLPETTSTWKGIRAAWVGKDSIDIQGLPPDFDWNIRIYGVFDDSVSCDTLPANLYREFTDPTTGSIWIRDKEKKLVDLEKGWYLMYARNRDDAYVSSIPAIGYLVVYEPTWIRHPEQTKRILLANHTYHPPSATIPGELPAAYRDSVINFYVQLIEAAGYTTDDYDIATYTEANANELEPPKADLYNHELVIVLNTDWRRPLINGPGKEQQRAYGKYLDVGGKLWIVGRRSFESQNTGGRLDFALSDVNYPLAYPYMNLSAVFAQSGANFIQAEFSGATAVAEGFPDVNVDTIKVAQTSTNNFRYSQGLIGVSFLIRLTESETIYRFSSLYPDTSHFHNFPVAIRYDKGTFKTSYFAFPLYFVRADQALAITQRMLDWFFEE